LEVEIPAFTWPVRKALTIIRDELAIHFLFGQWRIGPDDQTAVFVPTILFSLENIGWQQVKPYANYVSFCFEVRNQKSEFRGEKKITSQKLVFRRLVKNRKSEHEIGIF
jgi:hypothetical protein